MFRSPLTGEVLVSFNGELGNMIAGRLSIKISEIGTSIHITLPTVMQGNTRLSGYGQALELTVEFNNVGNMNIYLLLN